MRNLVLIAAGAMGIASAGPEATRQYTNSNWGFSVTVPRSLNYETTPAPNPNHGFRVTLSRASFVWVNADSSDADTLAQAATDEIRLWLSQACRLVRRGPDVLGNRPAERIRLRCMA